MKISKIAKLCKETKIIEYAVTEAGMWLGNGEYAYCIPEFSALEQDGLYLALGISEKDKEKYRIVQADLSGFDLRDISKAESLCEQIDFIIFRDKARPFITEEGIRFIDVGMLDVLREEIENLQIYLRRKNNGEAYFAAKIGMELYAILKPRRIINSDFIEKLTEFDDLCRTTFQNDSGNIQTEDEPSAQMKMEG